MTATHQEEAGALRAQLDLGVGRQGEERHPVLLVNGHGPAQEATGARTHTGVMKSCSEDALNKATTVTCEAAESTDMQLHV